MESSLTSEWGHLATTFHWPYCLILPGFKVLVSKRDKSTNICWWSWCLSQWYVSKSTYKARLQSVSIRHALLLYAHSNITFKLFPSVCASQILWKSVPNCWCAHAEPVAAKPSRLCATVHGTTMSQHDTGKCIVTLSCSTNLSSSCYHYNWRADFYTCSDYCWTKWINMTLEGWSL